MKHLDLAITFWVILTAFGCQNEDQTEETIGVIADDLDFSPPTFFLEGDPIVAMDIINIEAQLIFDLEQQTSMAHAVIAFRLGEDPGRPVFDLRQRIEKVELDSESLGPERVSHRSLGNPEGSEMRVVDIALPARSDHVLTLDYELETPNVLEPSSVTAPENNDDSLHWSFNLSELTAAHFLEQWLPANLIFDRYPIRLEIELRQTDRAHGLSTNGEVTLLEENHFIVQFAETTSAHSPMLILWPEDEFVRRSTQHELPDGMIVELRTETSVGADVDLAVVERMVAEAMHEYVLKFGSYQHGNVFTLFIWSGDAMEYDGSATVFFDLSSIGEENIAGSAWMNPSLEVVRHEVLHSWFGRGMQPTGQDHGWIDEAWVSYYTGDWRPPLSISIPQDWEKLVGNGPYHRDLIGVGGDPYFLGPILFSMIAEQIGTRKLDEIMSKFYRIYKGQRYDSEMLERMLFCTTGDENIRDLFHYYVYGRDGVTTPIDEAETCEHY